MFCWSFLIWIDVSIDTGRNFLWLRFSPAHHHEHRALQINEFLFNRLAGNLSYVRPRVRTRVHFFCVRAHIYDDDVHPNGDQRKIHLPHDYNNHTRTSKIHLILIVRARSTQPHASIRLQCSDGTMTIAPKCCRSSNTKRAPAFWSQPSSHRSCRPPDSTNWFEPINRTNTFAYVLCVLKGMMYCCDQLTATDWCVCVAMLE